MMIHWNIHNKTTGGKVHIGTNEAHTRRFLVSRVGKGTWAMQAFGIGTLIAEAEGFKTSREAKEAAKGV